MASKNLEAIARIIDPKAWDFYDFVVAQPQETAGQELLVRESLIKAQQIIDLNKERYTPPSIGTEHLFDSEPTETLTKESSPTMIEELSEITDIGADWEVSTSVAIGEEAPLDAIRQFIDEVTNGELTFELKNIENGNRYLVAYDQFN